MIDIAYEVGLALDKIIKGSRGTMVALYPRKILLNSNLKERPQVLYWRIYYLLENLAEKGLLEKQHVSARTLYIVRRGTPLWELFKKYGTSEAVQKFISLVVNSEYDRIKLTVPTTR